MLGYYLIVKSNTDVTKIFQLNILSKEIFSESQAIFISQLWLMELICMRAIMISEPRDQKQSQIEPRNTCGRKE